MYLCVHVCLHVFAMLEISTYVQSCRWCLLNLRELPCVIQTFRANLSMQAEAASCRQQQRFRSRSRSIFYLVWLSHLRVYVFVCCMLVCTSHCCQREMKALHHSPVRWLQILPLTHTCARSRTQGYTRTPEALTGPAFYWLPWSRRQQMHLIEASHPNTKIEVDSRVLFYKSLRYLFSFYTRACIYICDYICRWFTK